MTNSWCNNSYGSYGSSCKTKCHTYYSPPCNPPPPVCPPACPPPPCPQPIVYCSSSSCTEHQNQYPSHYSNGCSSKFEVKTSGKIRMRIDTNGVKSHDQSGPINKNADETLSVTEVTNGLIIIPSSASADFTLTLPTASDIINQLSLYENMSFEWSIINTSSVDVTIQASTLHSITGNNTVGDGTSGRFLTRYIKSSSSFITYRLS